jgi:hypothetical protein
MSAGEGERAEEVRVWNTLHGREEVVRGGPMADRR